MISKRYRICLFPPALENGGLERVFVNLASGFVAAGYAVDLVLVRKEGYLLGQVHPLVNVVSLDCQRMLTTLPKLCQYLREVRPDVALTGLSPTHTMMSLAKLFTGVGTRLFGSIHNTYPFDDKPTLKLLLQQRIEMASYVTAEKLIAVSYGVLNELIEKRRLSSKKIEVVYNPVLPENIDELMAQDSNHPFFGPGQPPVILGVGRLVKQKDFRTLIQAFRLAANKIPLKLIILGEGEERDELEQLIHRERLLDDVSLPGFVGNPYPYMRRARLFVLSSSWEGFANVLVEALASGCPIISTDCHSGPAEILANGRYGKLVPVGDPEMMANAILESLQDHVVAAIDPLWLRQFQLQPVAQRYLEVLGLIK